MTWDKVKRKDWSKTKAVTGAQNQGKKSASFKKPATAGKRTARPR